MIITSCYPIVNDDIHGPIDLDVRRSLIYSKHFVGIFGINDHIAHQLYRCKHSHYIDIDSSYIIQYILLDLNPKTSRAKLHSSAISMVNAHIAKLYVVYIAIYKGCHTCYSLQNLRLPTFSHLYIANVSKCLVFIAPYHQFGSILLILEIIYSYDLNIVSK